VEEQTDGQTDMTKLTVAFHNSAKAPKRSIAFVQGNTVVNEQSTKLKMNVRVVVFAVQKNQQDKLPDI